MLFASDLDQTLIYSKKFIGDSRINVRLIETKDEEEISYMAETAICKLKQLINSHCFVPVTTRTVEQYERILLFQNEIIPKYAITNNGGNILVDRKPDKEWNNRILKNTSSECLPLPDVLEEFTKIVNEQWIISQKHADNLFLYFIIVEDAVPFDGLECFKKWLGNSGWNISMQGRKLYLIPNCINKWTAVSYIKELAGEDKVFAAGDSMLDLCMLDRADFAVIPQHSELAKISDTKNMRNAKMRITKNSGILAAEDILDSINSALDFPLTVS